MSELLSYVNILNDIKNFKRSGTRGGSDFNIYDTPTHKYFKIMFYFGSQSEFKDNATYDDAGSGLLAPTWEIYNARKNSQFTNMMDRDNPLNLYDFNSAWSFLKMNDELERAEKLEQFVTLLSDISSQSPWYFEAVSGVQEALERKVAEDGKLDMSENKKITINCIPDSFDNRIGTLLELYRDITWSWAHKKEILPSNLRKFDMAIYIFETPETNWHSSTDKYDVVIGSNNEGFKASYKMIEFHDCEFGYNSIKSGWSELNNQTGASPKYSIEISYNDCYEISYNDIMMRSIGDVIITDLLNSSMGSDYISEAQTDDNKQIEEIKYRTALSEVRDSQDYIKQKKSKTYTSFGNLAERSGVQSSSIDEQTKTIYQHGFIENAVGQVVGTAIKDLKSVFTKAVLGNIYEGSLSKIGDIISGAIDGNLLPTIQKVGVDINKYANAGGQAITDAMKNLHGTKENASSAYNIEHQAIARTNPLSEKNMHEGDKAAESAIARTNPLSEKNMHEGDKKYIVNSPKKSIGNIFKSSTIANNI